MRISYPKGKPVETAVTTMKVDTNEEGFAAAAVQGRRGPASIGLRYKVTDSKNHTIEGGYVFTIIGDGFDGAQFRFNDIELIPDKREYAAGREGEAAGEHQPHRRHGVAVHAARPTACTCRRRSSAWTARARSRKSPW